MEIRGMTLSLLVDNIAVKDFIYLLFVFGALSR